jgi:hypothetical protein
MAALDKAGAVAMRLPLIMGRDSGPTEGGIRLVAPTMQKRDSTSIMEGIWSKQVETISRPTTTSMARTVNKSMARLHRPFAAAPCPGARVSCQQRDLEQYLVHWKDIHGTTTPPLSWHAIGELLRYRPDARLFRRPGKVSSLALENDSG